MATPTQTPSKLSLEIVQKAVNSLFKWRRAHSSLQARDDDHFNLFFTLQRIPTKPRRGSYRIELPTPLRLASETDICLIVDDRRNSKLWMMKAKADKPVTVSAEEAGVTKVLKISKLKSGYRALEEKRKLWDEYDVFLAEKRIVDKLPVLLGKHFYKNKKKMPLEVELERGMNWKEEVEKAVGSGYMHLSTGICCAVKIGRFGMEKREIVENVMAAVERIVDIMPRKWDSIRAFHLKLNESLSLPLYEAVDHVELDVEGVEERKKSAGKNGGGVKGMGEGKDESFKKKGEDDDDLGDESDGYVPWGGEDGNGAKKNGPEEMDVKDFGSKTMKAKLSESEHAIWPRKSRQFA